MVKSNFIDLGDASTVVAGRFKFAFIFELLSAGGPPFSHFDPFGTEFCVSRGGSAILSEFRIAKFGFESQTVVGCSNPQFEIRKPTFLQRAFQPSP